MRVGLAMVIVSGLAACTPEMMTPMVVGTPPAATPEAAAAVIVPGRDAVGLGPLLNAQRQAAGLPAAVPDARLQAAAEQHLVDMRTNSFFSHTGSDGSSAFARIAAAGFGNCQAGENIAGGQATAAGAMADWMNSSGHRANILMPGSVGYGIAAGDGLWVLTVGTPC